MSTLVPHTPALAHAPSSLEVVGLRPWGTDETQRLPRDLLRCSIGSDETCAVRITDPQIFPFHAHLTWEGRHWLIRSLGDSSGLQRDGAMCHAFVLAPGVEIGIRGMTLIAESAQWMAVRAFCARLLGFGPKSMPIVDRALRAIRMTVSHRVPLVLEGVGDLVPIARSLHARLLGPGRPFVLCDPRRRAGGAPVRSPSNVPTAAEAVRAAIGGTLCVRAIRLPHDFELVMSVARQPDAPFRLIVCSDRHERFALLPSLVPIPSLKHRSAELARIVDEYAQEATRALGVPQRSFTMADRIWVLSRNATSLAEIEKATLRLVALRTSADVPSAARRLGMATVSLQRWLDRRELLERL